MYTELIEFATPQFDVALKLRDEVLRKPLSMQFYEEDIATEYDSYHLACYNHLNQMIGILVLKPITDSVLKMRQVAVAPSLQGKGIGSFLVQSAEKLAKAEGYEKIELHARLEAVPFYKKKNYKPFGDKFDEVGIPHYKMVKNIK